MGHRDPRVDDYIEKAAPFAQPILIELRARMHAACPDLQETIKWRLPTFERGRILAGMAAFQRHCTFGFWHDQRLRELPGLAAILDAAGRTTSVDDLPPAAGERAADHSHAFPPGAQREYLEWIADGKRRNWKYEQC